MTHLVTGGSGFIGAGLVRELVDAGHAVRILDDQSRGHPRRLEGLGSAIEVVDGDVRDAATVAKATAGCEVVWHLAWINGTRHFYERPDAILEVGVKGTLNTIEAALANGVRRYVFMSTSETYNTPTHVPTTEAERLMIPDVTNPRFSYGGGKLTGELLTLHLGAHRGLESVIIRPHNIYGPDMGFAHVIPEVVARIIRMTDGLKSSNLDLPIQGDGSETRAFCYIDDGARGTRIAGEEGASGEIYHLGREEEVSIKDLIIQIGACLGVHINIVPGPLREGGTKRRCPATAKLEGLGYRSAFDLTTGLERTVAWYRDWYLTHGVDS